MFALILFTLADLGGGCRGCAPHPPEMKPSSLFSLLNFVYVTSQLCHSLLPPKKNPGFSLGSFIKMKDIGNDPVQVTMVTQK